MGPYAHVEGRVESVGRTLLGIPVLTPITTYEVKAPEGRQERLFATGIRLGINSPRTGDWARFLVSRDRPYPQYRLPDGTVVSMPTQRGPVNRTDFYRAVEMEVVRRPSFLERMM